MRKEIVDKVKKIYFQVSNIDDVHFLLQYPKLITEGICEFRSGSYGIDHIGAFTYLGGKNTSIRNVASIGRFCSIASNIVIGETEHPTDYISTSQIFHNKNFMWKNLPYLDDFYQRNIETFEKSVFHWRNNEKSTKKTVIGHDVWIGEGAFISSGISIGHGAIIAAKSVVTRDVPSYAVVGGVPAKIIKYRFSDNIIQKLLDLRWWAYGLDALECVDFANIECAVEKIEQNIVDGAAIFFPNAWEINFKDLTMKKIESDINFLTDGRSLFCYCYINGELLKLDFNNDVDRKVILENSSHPVRRSRSRDAVLKSLFAFNSEKS